MDWMDAVTHPGATLHRAADSGERALAGAIPRAISTGANALHTGEQWAAAGISDAVGTAARTAQAGRRAVSRTRRAGEEAAAWSIDRGMAAARDVYSWIAD